MLSASPASSRARDICMVWLVLRVEELFGRHRPHTRHTLPLFSRHFKFIAVELPPDFILCRRLRQKPWASCQLLYYPAICFHYRLLSVAGHAAVPAAMPPCVFAMLLLLLPHERQLLPKATASVTPSPNQDYLNELECLRN